MPQLDVTVFYLEMRQRPVRTIPPPREGLTVVWAKRPTVAYYRFLYNTVGREYHWYSRARLRDEDLATILHNPLNEVHVLFADGTPAGFVELDRNVEGETEIVQFGLMPEYIGQGLGRFFLHWAIDYIWRALPRRLWLHTCTLDHPAALPNYVKAGFTIYRQEIVKRDL